MTTPVLCEEIATNNGKIIGVLTLNSEKTLNSLTLVMVDIMLAQLQRWQKNDQIAAVFIQGAGEKAFCAGGDVQALHKSSADNPGGPCVDAERFFDQEYRLDYLLHHYGKPTIAWGHGIVMGGGLGVFAGCSHRIATEKTRIAMPEVTIGLFPDVGGSYFLNTMPGQCGRFLALTGASINGTDSLYAGIANHLVSHSKKDDVMSLLLALDWSSPAIETQLDDMFSDQQLPAEDIPAGNLAAHQSLINDLCAGDDVEAIAANIAALETADKWMQRAKAGLANGSPLAVKWIFQQLEICKGLSLKAVFQQEILLATNIVRHSEFPEGVRALLIDKDQNPQWQFKTLSDVPADSVAAFFVAPWPTNPLIDL
ncbi:Fatty acid oxidation complex subunit alpha [Sinobacterium norvegicum]|uniref:3-hydroxyisobutyryl-CoA hydrolase n=1 Tax=Sinobacterium norvegicum TaxID=1641715 RepID=A0ABM9AHG6_9GAMM|nr:enoyl-CoA hydratase/isomerase family protein [Sinobacterium norvegicum]CAH0992457.1 Fatty acid oxidation complex subunit alpha [Sinobacterium norvegicum]